MYISIVFVYFSSSFELELVELGVMAEVTFTQESETSLQTCYNNIQHSDKCQNYLFYNWCYYFTWYFCFVSVETKKKYIVVL